MPDMPSLSLLAGQVASERDTMNAHAESLDAKAGVILGFAGVLVGLGATAQSVISENGVFQAGLGVAVAAALLAAWAFLPRRYPVLEVQPLRDDYLTAPEVETQLDLLDTQIEMIRQAAELVKHKGRRVGLSVGCLAIAATLIVIGTLIAGGHVNARGPAEPRTCGHRTCATSQSARTAALQAEQETDRLHRAGPEAASGKAVALVASAHR
jgi:hypothetical protein